MKLRITLVGILTALAMVYLLWQVASSRSFQLAGEIVHRVERPDSLIAITFDDGPTPQASDTILSILKRNGVRATFFFTGAELAENPGLADRFVEQGHEIGNHTYSHPRMLLKSPSFIRREIEVTDSLLRHAGQTGPILFRPPFGKKLWGLPRYLADTGRVTVMWDVEPDSDPEIAHSADRIVDHVLTEVRPGSIILLHVMYESRRESLRAVDGMIRELRERGYQFAPVSELVRSGTG